MTDFPHDQNETPENLDCIKSKRRDREASEERLIEAGIEIFAKYGYNGATTKKIAKKAQVNESLIGRYFDGKEGLLLTIIERFISSMRDEHLPYPAQDSLIEELRQYVAFKMGNVHKKQALAKIIISQALTDDRFRKKSLERVPRFCDEKLLVRLQNLQHQEKIPKEVDVRLICYCMETYMHGQFLFESLLREAPAKEVIDQTYQFLDIFCLSSVLKK